jgi:uncharacterized protein YqeY
MHPKDQVQVDLKEAMKSGDVKRRDILRQLSAAFKQSEVDTQKPLSEADALQIVRREIKRLQESQAELEKAGRPVDEVLAELAILEGYLPPQLDRATLSALAQAAIAEVGATSAKQMGDVMKVLMPKIQGQADGKVVNEVVRDLLK